MVLTESTITGFGTVPLMARDSVDAGKSKEQQKFAGVPCTILYNLFLLSYPF